MVRRFTVTIAVGIYPLRVLSADSGDEFSRMAKSESPMCRRTTIFLALNFSAHKGQFTAFLFFASKKEKTIGKWAPCVDFKRVTVMKRYRDAYGCLKEIV